jgi:hypothetical protein
MADPACHRSQAPASRQLVEMRGIFAHLSSTFNVDGMEYLGTGYIYPAFICEVRSLNQE